MDAVFVADTSREQELNFSFHIIKQHYENRWLKGHNIYRYCHPPILQVRLPSDSGQLAWRLSFVVKLWYYCI